MKFKYIISAVIIFLIFLAFIIKPDYNNMILEESKISRIITSSNSTIQQNQFLLGFFLGGQYDLLTQIDPNSNNIDRTRLLPLNLNLFQRLNYTANDNGLEIPNGVVTGDYLSAPFDNYSSEINSYYKRIAGCDRNYTQYLSRPKIEYLCFGQSSVYRCIDIPPNADKEWFYSYDESQRETGEEFLDPIAGETVIKCSNSNVPNNVASKYAVKGLKANCELCEYKYNGYSYSLYDDGRYAWYILPKLRINPSDAQSHKLVCIVEFVDWNGQTINQYTTQIYSDYFLKKDGTYYGDYTDKFNFSKSMGQNNGYEPIKIPANLSNIFNPNHVTIHNGGNGSQFDIRIKYAFNCDLYIDQIKVQNDIAYDLMDGDNDPDPQHNSNHLLYNNYWIDKESQLFKNEWSNINPYKFYADELRYNQLPCVAYINNRLSNSTFPEIKNNARVSCLINADFHPYFMLNTDAWNKGKSALGANYFDCRFSYSFIKSMIQKIDSKDLLFELYPLAGYPHTEMNGQHSYLPNSVITQSDPNNGILAEVAPSVDAYEKNLQELIDGKGIFEGMISSGLSLSDSLSKELNIPFIFGSQIHSDFSLNSNPLLGWCLREPLNEEIEAMQMIALTYNVKGILNFILNSSGSFNVIPPNNYSHYLRGVLDIQSPPNSNNFPIIYNNAYNQEQSKWDRIKNINTKIRTWEKYLLKFDPNLTSSYKIHDWRDKERLINNSFIQDVITISKPYDDNHIDLDPAETYVQIGKFDENNDYHKVYNRYLMVVNRRCAPTHVNQPDTPDGWRKIKLEITPNSPYLANFNNWTVIDLNDNSFVTSFDKTQQYHYIDLGIFEPGQAKLLKFTPTISIGGGLITDEEIGNGIIELDCEGMVWCGGFNINIPNKVTINFLPGAGITTKECEFTTGDKIENYGDIIFRGKDGGNWEGFKFYHCKDIVLSGCQFIGSPAIDTANRDYKYLVNLIDCNNVNINNCDFQITNNSLAGAIQMTSNRRSDVIDQNANVRQDAISAYIGYNYFSTDISEAPIVAFYSVAPNFKPLMFEYNTLEALNANCGNTGLFMSNVPNAVIKNNVFNNYLTSVSTMSTSADFYANTITCNRDNAIGISGLSSSFVRMGKAGNLFTGGANTIANMNPNSSNLTLWNSMFDIDGGCNNFLINYNDSTSYNFTGNLYSDAINDIIPSRYNCFNSNTAQIPKHEVFGFSQSIIDSVFANLLFTPHSCTPFIEINGLPYTILPVTDNVNDTVHIQNENNVVSDCQALYDSIDISARRCDFGMLFDQTDRFIDNYIDSVQCVEVLSKAYLSCIALDSAGDMLIPFEAVLADIIQNETDNIALVSRAFYLDLKCKSALGQFQDAMTGFQIIITQNPYSYEGLLASWDYSATALLADTSGHGTGGSTKEDENSLNINENSENTLFEILINQMLDSLRKERKITLVQKTHDNDAISKTAINKSIEKVFEEGRKKTIQKIEDLQKKINSNDDGVKSTAKKKLIQMKKLGETVKTKKPKNIIEHINFINKDIKKVFGGKTDNSNNIKRNNLIPTEYKLYQNYPNPFNPTTKIVFDLPKDSKVTLVIYDILGREMVKLANNEFMTAGRYTKEFNALALSSGVYFFRIIAENNTKFIETKKMLLIK